MTTLVGAGEVADVVAKKDLKADERAAPDSQDAASAVAPEEAEAISDGDADTAHEVSTLAEESSAEFGPPFTPRSFGGELVWTQSSSFTSKVLRIRAGEVVLISTTGRSDMVAMLTGGRAVLEVEDGGEIIREEITPGFPTAIRAESAHRIVAMTDVELFTAYANSSGG
jgi:hypothetical protein